MTTNPSRRMSLGFLPTFGEFILLLPALAIAMQPSGLSSLLNDGDTGWHIRTGEWILSHRTVPRTDFYSFTKAGQEWFAWEWLWDVLAAVLHSQWGLTGIALATLFVLCITYYWLYRCGLARSGNPLFSTLAAIVVIFASWSHWLARPHVFTLLFLVFTIWWIRRHHRANIKRLFLLVPLTILWVNIHGGFVLLFLLLGAYAAGAMLRSVTLQGDARREEVHAATIFALVAITCGLASLVNPYGWKLHAHIFHYLQDPILRERTTEFRPPQLANPRIAIVFILDLFAIAWFASRKQYTELILIGGTGLMALSSVRHVSVHALIVMPMNSEALAGLAEWASRYFPLRAVRELLLDLGDSAKEWAEIKPTWASFTIPSALALCWMFAGPHLAPSRFTARFSADEYPVEALNSIPATTTGLRIFYDDRPGYVIYRLWPRAHVFWDGRLDFYGSGLIPIFDRICNAEPGWRLELERAGVNTVVLHKNLAIAQALAKEPRWNVLYDDGQFILFILRY